MRIITLFYCSVLLGALSFAPVIHADPTDSNTVQASVDQAENAEPSRNLPVIDAAMVPDLEALNFEFSQPLAQQLRDQSGAATTLTGEFHVRGLYFIDAYRATESSIAQIDALLDASIGDLPADTPAAFVNFDTLNGDTPDPRDDQTTVKEARMMDLVELRAHLEKQKEDILRRTVQEIKAGINGHGNPQHIDVSRKNVCIMLVRVTGISGLSMLVGVQIAGAALAKAIFQTALPAALSGWLMIANPGYMKWNQGKSLNPFTAELGDFKIFQESRLLENFPLSLVKKVPLPFVDPNPGVPIPEHEKVGAFSPRAVYRMFGFLVTYLSLAHVSTSAYESIWVQNPDFASITSWYTISDVVNIGAKCLFAFPAELLTARLIGDLGDKYDLRVAKDYVTGKIQPEQARERIRKGMTMVLASVATMSIINSVSQIRLAVSTNVLFDIGSFQFTDGHAAVLGMAAILGGAYVTVVKSPWAIAKSWADSFKRAYFRARESTKDHGVIAGMKDFFGYGPRSMDRHPHGDHCANSFIP